MTSTGRWRTLDLSISGAPKLLLKTHIASTGYEVQLTDLSRVWAEKLNKKDIIRRAWDDGCSIDPSEDDKQFSVFLEKIEGALNCEDGTTLDLLPNGETDLQLRLSAELPRPFKTLVWNVSLARRSDSALADSLTVPLLQEASSLQSQVQQLIHELQEKDRIIDKLSDRLETSGNDLTTVFPGVSNVRTNKKKSQREQLAKHVKGLADFDEADWRSRRTSGSGSAWWPKVGGVLRELPDAEDTDSDQSVERQWWRHLSDAPRTAVETGGIHATSTSSPRTRNGTSHEPEESILDDFQRQATPEHLRRRSSVQTDAQQNRETAPNAEATDHQGPAQMDDGESTTEDEDDLDAAPKHKPASSTRLRTESPPTTTNSAPAQPPRRLGAIGGRTSKQPPSPAREVTPDVTAAASKPKSKLGAIGGQAKPPSASPEPPSAPAPSASRKMGVIGGKRKPAVSTAETVEQPGVERSPEPTKERSRATTKEPTPPPRETSQERADRKRDQLKKELEQKAKAPAKKKRKF